MVELRVINGGRLKEEEFSCPAVKLFSASSVVNNFCGHDGVKFNWFYVGREKPVAPYDRLICGYKCIDRRVRPYFEEHMNELFTEDELEALKAYLLKSPLEGTSLEACEEALPASGLFIPMPFFSGVPIGEGRGLYHPPEEEYSLPFKVAAYYDLRNCPASSTLTDDSRQNGIGFLAEALTLLGLRSEVSTIELESTVEILYARLGFYVQQESNRARDTRTEES